MMKDTAPLTLLGWNDHKWPSILLALHRPELALPPDEEVGGPDVTYNPPTALQCGLDPDSQAGRQAGGEWPRLAPVYISCSSNLWLGHGKMGCLVNTGVHLIFPEMCLQEATSQPPNFSFHLREFPANRGDGRSGHVCV